MKKVICACQLYDRVQCQVFRHNVPRSYVTRVLGQCLCPCHSAPDPDPLPPSVDEEPPERPKRAPSNPWGRNGKPKPPPEGLLP